MVIPNEEACRNIELGDKLTHMQNLSRVIGKTMSSYTKAINIQNKTTGNLFQKKTQAKCLSDTNNPEKVSNEYVLTCFHYIHQNPLISDLVRHLKDWKYSSFPDYYGYRNGTLCNRDITMKLLSLTENDFKNEEPVSLNQKKLIQIF